MTFENIRAIVDRHRITYAIIAALLISIVMTMISMALYVSSGASRLDLSRPGYEKARTELTTQPHDTPFNSSGSINTRVLDDFQNRLDKLREEQSKLGTFSSNALGDTELQIAVPVETTE